MPRAAHWSREAFPGDTSLIELARTPDGDSIASGSGGAIWKRDSETAAWTRTGDVSTRGFSPALAGVCIGPSGTGHAVGEGVVARTADGGATWAIAPQVPELHGTWFGYAYLNTIACAPDGSTIGAGYWSAARSTDGGSSWERSDMLLEAWDIPAQVAAVEIAPSGTVVSVGYPSYVGRSADGRTFTQITPPGARDWYTAAAAAPGGHWWIAGERGAIHHSSDDGATFRDQSLAGFDEDLYAISFWDERTGLAVGAHGAALYTSDGGTTWQEVSTGLDTFLGDVVFLAADRALVVGERGTVLVFTP